MKLKDEITADMMSIEEDLENPVFTWKDNDYTCIPSPANEAKDLGPGGFDLDADLILNVRLDQFVDGTLPEEQKAKILFRGKYFRVVKVGMQNHQASMRLYCVDPHRNL